MIGLGTFPAPSWLVLTFGAFAGGISAWCWQANDYDRQLAEQALQYAHQREDAATVALDQLQAHQAQRRALETQLQAQDKLHYEAMSNAKKDRDRLRDQLATADVRLSVLVRAGAGESGHSGVREAAGTGRLVDGGQRAELDAAHAQRIVSIVEDGDDGLRALAACQAYMTTINQ